jgi:hypothetical protein
LEKQISCGCGDDGERDADMNDTTDLGQADENILIYDVSDEALEAAAGTERGPDTYPYPFSLCPP